MEVMRDWRPGQQRDGGLRILRKATTVPVSIRQAVPKDAPTLARMRWDDSTEDGTSPAQPYAEFAAGFADFVRSALAGGQWVIWVTESDARLIAHIYVQVVRMTPRPGRFTRRYGYVTAVYAVPEARNKGTGSELLQRVIAWAKEEQLELLILWPNEGSVPFYERAGFARGLGALELQLGP
jgi:GNAT superfamily N-acetyltransferase